MDQQFVEFVVKALVGDPDAVSIERTIDEKGVLLELTVAPEDLGRVIGKRGGTAQSIRTLLRALGTKNDARYNLKIVDTDGGSGATHSQPRSDDSGYSNDDTAYANSSTQDYSATADDSGSEFEDTTAVEQPADNPVEEVEVETVENEESDYAKKTRNELADLDDLDI
ncbi:KH domain-containing protein [Candidatus Saccharibacteria bacterium]|nr:KH domain-containing protein [Candidatus Saccharibacteria bacterium]